MAALKNRDSAINKLVKGTSFESTLFDNFRDDKEIVLMAIEKGAFFKYASEKLRDDRDFALQAINLDSDSYILVSDRLKSDRELSINAISLRGRNIDHAPKEFQVDIELLKLALKTNGSAIYNTETDSPHRYDKELALLAVKNDGMVLDAFAPSIRNDKEVAFEAVKNCQFADMKFGKELKQLLDTNELKKSKDIIDFLEISIREEKIEKAYNKLKNSMTSNTTQSNQSKKIKL
jgi:hypothetical protein